MKRLVLVALLLVLFDRSAPEAETEPQRQEGVPDLNAALKELSDADLRDSVAMQHLEMLKIEEVSPTRIELWRVTSELETLQRQGFESATVLETRAEQPRVAFSVGLTGAGRVGPFAGVTTLVYKKIFYNLSQAYNPMTGGFTAPTKGAYYFIVTGFNDQVQPGAPNLYLNGSRLHHHWSPGAQVTYFSSAVTVQVQVGDVVYTQLLAGHTLFDNEKHLCTLTGFLLFSL